MLGVRHTRRVAWKRHYALQHYVGYVTVTEDGIRLAGREHATGIDAALTIPYTAITSVRLGDSSDEEVVGAPSVVLELREDDSICVRPVDGGELDLDAFARRLRPLTV
jgi:hypothetical protein